MNAYTRQDLSVMQAWPLDRKIRVTQAKIIEWYHHYGGKVAVSFSGGKDSTVLLDLARRAFPDIPAVFVDTGLEYPEIREFVKTCAMLSLSASAYSLRRASRFIASSRCTCSMTLRSGSIVNLHSLAIIEKADENGIVFRNEE